MPPLRETRGRAADAQRRDTSAAGAATSVTAHQEPSAARGSSTRSRSSEPWDTAEGSSSNQSAAAAASASGSGNRRDGGRSRHGAAAASTDASSSSSSTATSHRRQSGDHSRRSGGSIRSSSRMQQMGGSLDRRRSSSGSFNSNCSDEQEEEATCPLCLEALDETDRGLFPCECGYQVCLWCLHHIRDHLANKCPACRRDYDEKKFKYDQSRVVELTKQIGRKSRDKTCGSSDATRSGSSGGGSSSNSRTACAAAARSGAVSSSSGGASSSSSSTNRALAATQQGAGAARRGSREAAAAPPAQAAALKDVRVIQRCLVYVIGIPPSIAKKEILRRHEFFGQYGKVLQIVVNKNQGHWGGPSYAVYVTYATSKEAVAAIQGVDGAVYEGRTLKASFGTTKYCSHFLKGVRCQNPDCSYLHQLGSGKDSFTKEAMISAKHQFLDLTFPSSSEREQTASLFGKLPESGVRSTHGHPSEEPEGHGDSAGNEEAGPGAESEDSDTSPVTSSATRSLGKGSIPPAATTTSTGGDNTASAAPAPPSSGNCGDAEEGQKSSRGAKSKGKQQGTSCSTWASVAAGGAKPSTAAACAATSAPTSATPATRAKSQQPAPTSPAVSSSQPAQQKQNQEAGASESDTERDIEPQPGGSAAGNTEAPTEEVLSESEAQEAEHQPGGIASPEPSDVPAVKSDTPQKDQDIAAEGATATATPAEADDAGIARQHQHQQHERQHEQQEPPQQPPSWPCFHPDFPQRPLGTPLVTPGLQGALLDSMATSILPSAAAGAGGAPQQLQALLPAQQQRPMVQQLDQQRTLQLDSRTSLLTGMDVSSLSTTEQLMHQLQQQHQPLRPCAPDRMFHGGEPVGTGGGRFGPPPGLEALSGSNGNRGCRTRSHSSSSSRLNLNNSLITTPGGLLGQLGAAGTMASLPFTDEPHACRPPATSSSNSSSRFAFASNADGDDDALFEIPGMEDCLSWLENPGAQGAGSGAAEANAPQQQGPLLLTAERSTLLETTGGGEALPLPLANNNWTQQRHNKDFVFGPGVGGASLPTLQQQPLQQRQPSERWRHVCQHQHAPGLVLQAKAAPSVAAAPPSIFDRFDAHNARRGGWSTSDRFSGHEHQQQQLQQEQLQHLLRQQQQMVMQQQQQQQARARAAAVLPTPPEQQSQQPQLLVQQQQQQLALLQQLLPAACALGRGSSAPPADPEEALKLLLSLIPSSGQAQRLPPQQQQQPQLRYGDSSSSSFPLGTSGNRDADATTRMRPPRVGPAVLPRSQVGAAGTSAGRGADEGSDSPWVASGPNAASEGGRGRSAARKGSASSLETTDRGGGFSSFHPFDPRLSDSSQYTAGTLREAAPGGPTDTGGISPPPTHAGSELLPFLQRQRMQQIQQQQLQQLQRALESQRLE